MTTRKSFEGSRCSIQEFFRLHPIGTRLITFASVGRNMMIVVIAAISLTSENRIMNARTINRIELVCQVARFGLLLALCVLALSALFAIGAPVKDDHSNR